MGKSMIAVPPHLLAELKRLRDLHGFKSIASLIAEVVLPDIEGHVALVDLSVEELKALHQQTPRNIEVRSVYLAKKAVSK